MAHKAKKNAAEAATAGTPVKARGYTVAKAPTTDPVQLAAMREPDVQTSGGRNTRHLVRTDRP